YFLDCLTANFNDPSTAHQPAIGATTCPGASTGDYLDNSNIVETFVTSGTTYVTVTWNNINGFYLCSGDVLKVYDGPSNASPLLQTNTGPIFAGFNGATMPAAVSSSGSSITFEFISDASGHAKGWNASLTCSPILIPANNECTTATSVFAGSPCTATNGTTKNATQSTAPATVCSGTPNDDVWYSFVATTTNPTITVTGTASTSSMQPVAQLCVGPAATPTQSTLGGTVCAAAAAPLGSAILNPTGLTVGTTYYVRVFDSGNNSTGNAYTFTICITGATQQDCAGALDVNSYFTLTGTATSYGTQEYSSTTFGCLVGGEHRSLWYKMKVTSVGTIGFTLTPAAGQDIDFAIWGPYANSNCSNITTAPLRCTFAANGGSAGGLSDSYFDGTEGAGGDGWLRSIGCPTCTSTYGETAVAANQYYIFLIDGWSTFNGSSLSLVWTGSSSLPITLSDFYGQTFLDYNLLNWSTLSEFNNDFWTIERSADGETFETISTMDGYELSTTMRDYQYYDRSPLSGNNYYRLKQTDIGGAYTYSNVVLLKNYGEEIAVQDIYPNPTNGAITVNLYSGESYNCVVHVMDETGKMLMDLNQPLEQGNNYLQIDLHQFHNGIYFLQLINPRSGDVVTKKVVKM
ncbi:MAG: T9SS type A sorting domain-containing protein, partial [Chitinophagales bacterium]